MKQFTILVLALFPFLAAFAQFTLEGTVLDNNKAAPDILVEVTGPKIAALTDENGRFVLKDVPAGSHELLVSSMGTNLVRRIVDVQQDAEFTISVQGEFQRLGGIDGLTMDEIEVLGIIASENTPATFVNLSKEDLQKNNLGLDVPFLLDQTPSVVVTSDAGAGIGYTGIRIRGSDPTRTNVTINGVPLNDSESQGTFWVDLPDFASSVDNLQIQRGVGTSTNGAGAFGASVNMQTLKPSKDAYGSISNSYGSFNTRKHSLSLGTGLLKGHWSFDGRLSTIQSDGYIDRAQADLNSWFAGASYVDDLNSLKLNVFSGHEITYQAWNGVPLSELEAGNYTFNPSGDRGDGTYHEDEVDNYRQDHYQLHYSRDLKKGLFLQTSLHYTHGEGYFEQYKVGEDLVDYGLNTSSLDALGIESSNLIRRRWLDNDFYGAIVGLKWKQSKFDLNIGAAVNNYEGGHFGEVIWSQYAGDAEIGQRYYDNDAEKMEWNIYSKVDYRLSKKLLAYLDLQYRYINYEFLGFDNDGSNITQDDQLGFFNPKVGLSYLISPLQKTYVYFGVANREPNRSDYTESTPDSRPRSEKLYDLEAGYQGKLGNVDFSGNLYYMLYKDQLALNGGINDVGEYTRINIDDSYRAGIELMWSIPITQKFTWKANATFSQNKVKNFTEIIDAFNAPNYELERVELNYENTDLAFSPNIIAGSELNFSLFDFKNGKKQSHGMNIALVTKYVGEQFIDNTSNENANLFDVISNETVNNRKLDAYLVNDIRLNYDFRNQRGPGISLTFIARNIMDEKYINNAYAFRFIVDNELGEGEGYFPQAGRNFLVGLNVHF